MNEIRVLAKEKFGAAAWCVGWIAVAEQGWIVCTAIAGLLNFSILLVTFLLKKSDKKLKLLMNFQLLQHIEKD